MKRLLLLLGCVAAFSSCLKNDKFERDMTSTGYIIYSSAAKQTLVALDPFNVAFRLNILIAEGDGDFNAAPDFVDESRAAVGQSHDVADDPQERSRAGQSEHGHQRLQRDGQ